MKSSKKNILFAISNLEAGGGQKSLVNLLETIDYSRFNVDLVLISPSGIFKDLIPKEVAILDLGPNNEIYTKQLFTACFSALKSFKLKLIYNRILFFLKNSLIKNKAYAEQVSWKNKQEYMSYFDNNYDAAIGFLEKSSIYFIVDNVKAKKKIGFIHNDYNKLNLKAGLDRPYFNKLNHIVTVSEECENVLKRTFPNLENKVSVMFNIVSIKLILKMASANTVKEYNNANHNILSVGRLHLQKGFDFSIDACKILVNKGINVTWYIIGDGSERTKLEDMIKKHGLEKHFILLGLRKNPYPYIKNCTIYAQTSRYEGKSIAIDEAKILQKPILATNFSTVYDQLSHNKTALICDMNAESIAKNIELLINSTELQQKLRNNLKKESLGTEQEIKKLYKFIQD